MTMLKNVKFEELLTLEAAVQHDNATIAFAPTFWERERAADRQKANRARLYAALDALTDAEAVGFGSYRQEANK